MRPMLLPISRQSSYPAIDPGHLKSAAVSALEALQASYQSASHGNYKHSVKYHIGLLVLGFLASLLSSYVLSHAASNLGGEVGLLDVLFGVVILSIATTLPESHSRYQQIPRPRPHPGR